MSQFPLYPPLNTLGETSTYPIIDEKTTHSLKTDVRETESDVIVTFDIPGLEKNEDVDIHILSNHILSVNGTVNHSTSKMEGRYHQQERYVGTFHRKITLPSMVSDTGVKAFYKKGILEVRMQKLDRFNQKKIEIEFH